MYHVVTTMNNSCQLAYNFSPSRKNCFNAMIRSAEINSVRAFSLFFFSERGHMKYVQNHSNERNKLDPTGPDMNFKHHMSQKSTVVGREKLPNAEIEDFRIQENVEYLIAHKNRFRLYLDWDWQKALSSTIS